MYDRRSLNGNMAGKGNMDTNKCKCAGNYARRTEAT